jgi:hypothetical protein
MKTLSNNQELYDYLCSLRELLERRGAFALGRLLANACAHAASMSVEFLGESRLALHNVLREAGAHLTNAERSEAEDVIRQIDSAFQGR